MVWQPACILPFPRVSFFHRTHTVYFTSNIDRLGLSLFAFDVPTPKAYSMIQVSVFRAYNMFRPCVWVSPACPWPVNVHLPRSTTEESIQRALEEWRAGWLLRRSTCQNESCLQISPKTDSGSGVQDLPTLQHYRLCLLACSLLAGQQVVCLFVHDKLHSFFMLVHSVWAAPCEVELVGCICFATS